MSSMEVAQSSFQCTCPTVSPYNIFLIVPKYLLFQLDAPKRSGGTETILLFLKTVLQSLILQSIIAYLNHMRNEKIVQGTLVLINTIKY